MAEDQPTRPPSPSNPSNRLAAETSAYLRQHMTNPVDWYPWGDEALARAREDGKPLLVSIGYSACHWCHVMERESFEDPETAALINELFVPIKVDREERPDVDQIYMDTVMRLSGHGGWPLTVFCASDGRPFHAGTYSPPEPRHGLPSFRDVLRAASRAWQEQRDQVDEMGRRILAGLAERPRGVAEGRSNVDLLTQAAGQLMTNADRTHGGFGGAPKFPTPTNLDLLLTALPEFPEEQAADARRFLVLTCNEMAGRGLYDQLGGGFHRYCVDDQWGVPHFEKMLYDQGQLLRSYAATARACPEASDALAWPVRETAAYLGREMTAPDGGLYASQDADSEGVEGLFYVWTPDQVHEVLGPEAAAAFCRAYAVTAEGNFEGNSVLWSQAAGPRRELQAERQALFEARARRVAPATDRKRLASWNGFAISGLAYAGSLFREPALLSQAIEIADFVLDRLRDDNGRLLRVYAEGTAKIPAFLDDLAAMLAACLDLHRAGAGERFAETGVGFAEEIAARFFDPDENDLFLTPSDGEPLVHRPRSDHDGATPHSAGLAVLGLLRAASLTGRDDLRSVATRVLRTYAFSLERAPSAHPTLLRAAFWAEQGLSAAVVAGNPENPATTALADRARWALAPEELVIVVADPEATTAHLDSSWIAGRFQPGQPPTAFVCRGTTCSLPITDPADLNPLEAPPS